MYFLFANPHKPDTVRAARDVAQALIARGQRVSLDDWLYDELKIGDRGELGHLTKDTEAVISLGGDGTLLRTLPSAAALQIPVVGVNMGRVGFLLETNLRQLSVALDRLIEKDYFIEERMMLRCQIKDRSGSFLVMNDVVLSRGGNPSSIIVDAYADEELIYSTHGDGIIVASPTGSTGYCLSAGGPVLHPGMQALVVLPICTHKAQQLPIVLKEDVRIRLSAQAIPSRNHQVVLDGQTCFEFSGTAEVSIQRAQERARFIRFEPQHFFTRLRLKQAEWSCK